MGGSVLIWDANIHFFHTDCYTGRREEYVRTIFEICDLFLKACLVLRRRRFHSPLGLKRVAIVSYGLFNRIISYRDEQRASPGMASVQ